LARRKAGEQRKPAKQISGLFKQYPILGMEINSHIPRIACSAQEAAEMIGVKYQTILAEIRAGRLVARRVGKGYRIHRDMIDEYLKCPDQESRPASSWTPKQAIGASSNPMARAVASPYEGLLLSKLRTKR
jgi:excisionase family DNA binding protein